MAARWAPALLVMGLTLFHAINNWIWLNKNLMSRGWDRAAALVNSLLYHQTLSEITLQSLFKASTQDQIRPPLFGVSMAMMYKLFGVSPDVAVMVNVLYMAILIGAIYGIGSQLSSRRLGMVSAVLVALIPLVFAMSRYSYFEFGLTALTASSIYLMLATRRFEKRGFSILLGISLGLGFLLKRTFPIFVLGAAGVVFFQARLLQRLWSQLKVRPRVKWREVGLALAGGALIAALWYVPNRETAQTLPMGSWLFPIWWGLSAVTIYLLLQPSSPGVNFSLCAGLTLGLASLWYLPHSDFIQRALRAGWGVDDPRGRTVAFASLETYTDYLDSILYGFGPIYVLLLILALGLLLLYLVVRRRRFLPEPWWNWGWWTIIASLLVAYVLLSTSIYKEHRAITPLLPLLGLILAGALWALPWHWLRIALITVAITFGLLQFFAISHTETSWLVQKTTFEKPVLGQVSVFAQGPYLEVPDSGLNDPGFFIADDVLQRVEATRQREGWQEASLSVVAGSSHVHAGMFVYDQLVHYPAIQVENPLQAHPGESAYSTAYRYDYVLVLNRGSRGSAMREAADRILSEHRASFDQAFELEKVYALPDGSEVYLFQRRYRPVAGTSGSSLFDAAAYLGATAEEDDIVIVHPPGLLAGFLEHYSGAAPARAYEGLGSAQGRSRLLFLLTTQEAESSPEVRDLLSHLGPPIEEQQLGELRVVVLQGAGP